MKTILQEQRRSSVIVALITMVLGAVLVVWPDRSVRLMCTLLGAALLICGLVYILGWLVRRREGGISAFTLIPGVVLSGLGIWLMTSSDSVIAGPGPLRPDPGPGGADPHQPLRHLRRPGDPDRPGADLRRAQRPVDHPPAEPDGAGPGAGSEWGHHRDKGAGLG